MGPSLRSGFVTNRARTPDTSVVLVPRADIVSAVSNLRRCEALADDCASVRAQLTKERDDASALVAVWEQKARDERRRRVFVRGVHLGAGACLTPELRVQPCATVSYGITFNPF